MHTSLAVTSQHYANIVGTLTWHMQAAYDMPMSDAIVIGMPVWHTEVMSNPELKNLAARYHRAQAKADGLRAELFDAIRAESAKDDVKQVDIVNDTGFTREHIRRIVKAGSDSG